MTRILGVSEKHLYPIVIVLSRMYVASVVVLHLMKVEGQVVLVYLPAQTNFHEKAKYLELMLVELQIFNISGKQKSLKEI